MIFISAAGSPAVAILIASSMVLVGSRQGGYMYPFYSVMIIGVIIFDTLLKWVFQRQRPATYVVPRYAFFTFSFPSGHASSAMALYGVIPLVMPATSYSLVCAAIIVSWIFLIGISRVYLGAHYPSDVVFGWLLGFIGLAFAYSL